VIHRSKKGAGSQVSQPLLVRVEWARGPGVKAALRLAALGLDAGPPLTNEQVPSRSDAVPLSVVE